MNDFQGNSFETGRTRLKYILIFELIVTVCTLFIPETVTGPRAVLSVLVILGFIAAIYTLVKDCRCPYCNRVIFMGVLNVRECPHCRRNLITGKKMKKSKR